MNCPHCNAEMRQDQVFCEKCGKERLLVPVYEPEIEDSVAISMKKIIDEITPGKKRKKKSSDALENERISNHTYHQLSVFIFSLIALVVFIGIFSVSFFIYTENSYDYQFDKAQDAFNEKDYDTALEHLDRCIAIDNNTIEARVLKLHIYQEQGLTDMVIEKAYKILELDPNNFEANKIMIEHFESLKDYKKLNEFVKDCTNEDIRNLYYDYMALAPEFDTEEGEFDEPISLKLISNGTGDIFYTTDGTTPSKYTDRYTGPIKLISGTYKIEAIYINNFGIVSPVIEKTYTIQNAQGNLPIISVESGTYSTPKVISVIKPDEEDMVFFTTNGSDPTMDSNLFTNAIPMPLGDSTFKFLMVDANGNESEIVTCNYSCQLDAVYNVDQAIILLKQQLIVRGDILDVNGTIAGSTDVKEYRCDSAVSYNNNVYYYVNEFIKNASGSLIRTGNNFGINIKDGSIIRISISDEGNVSGSEL